MPKFPTKFTELFWHAHGNFEKKNKALESSTVIIDYYITINACYN